MTGGGLLEKLDGGVCIIIMIIVLNWEAHLFVSMLCIQCTGGITVG